MPRSDKYVSTNKYEPIINQALKNYIKHAERPGYPDGSFTCFRHSFKQTSEITQLLNHVNGKSEDTAKNNIISHLKIYPQNNHSFNAYLLDELKRNDAKENWSQHERDRIIYFEISKDNSLLYRGDTRSPKEIFNKGFEPYKTSEKIEDYASARSLSVGVST